MNDYTQRRLELLEQIVKEVTDYGFNDEYGYYNDWADGVKPILEKAIQEAIAEERGRVEEMRDAPPPYSADKENPMKHIYQNEGYVRALDDLISSLDDLLSLDKEIINIKE